MIDLDTWLPDPQITTCHSRTAAVDPDTLWAAARRVRLDQTRTIGHLVRWRIPGVPQDQTFRRLFATQPFTLLAEGERWSLSGLAGRIWTLQRDYPRLDGPEDWRAWDEPHTARVLFAHWAQPADGGGAELVSEARVAATDRHGAMRLRGLWFVVRRFERVIGAEPLSLAARRVADGGR